jgi:polar amino acid transport system substrate-binding protein
MPLTSRLLFAALLASLSFSALGERLRIVTEPWSPYVIADDKQVSGLDYEMTNIVFKRWALMCSGSSCPGSAA